MNKFDPKERDEKLQQEFLAASSSITPSSELQQTIARLGEPKMKQQEKNYSRKPLWVAGVAAAVLAIAGSVFVWTNAKDEPGIAAVADGGEGKTMASLLIGGAVGEGDSSAITVPGLQTEINQYKVKLAVCMKAKGFESADTPLMVDEGHPVTDLLRNGPTEPSRIVGEAGEMMEDNKQEQTERREEKEVEEKEVEEYSFALVGDEESGELGGCALEVDMDSAAIERLDDLEAEMFSEENLLDNLEASCVSEVYRGLTSNDLPGETAEEKMEALNVAAEEYSTTRESEIIEKLLNAIEPGLSERIGDAVASEELRLEGDFPTQNEGFVPAEKVWYYYLEDLPEESNLLPLSEVKIEELEKLELSLRSEDPRYSNLMACVNQISLGALHSGVNSAVVEDPSLLDGAAAWVALSEMYLRY